MEERSQSPGRMAAGVVTLALVAALLAAQVSTAPPAAAASISVSPVAGVAGSSATVAGSAFLPLLPVELCWGGEGCSNLGSAIADATGGFSAGITIPGVNAGSYSISACQAATGCTTTVFEVLDPPNASTTTVGDTTTSTVATTTTTSGSTTTRPPTTTTTTRPSTTTSRPSTTTTPSPTTTTTSPTTTIPGSPSSSTSTSLVAIVSTSTSLPLIEASAAPFALDLDTLIDQLFAEPAPTEETVPETEAAGALGPAVPGEVEDADSGGSSGPASAVVLPELPRAGIWIGWTIGIIVLTALVLTMDEMRRRRSR